MPRICKTPPVGGGASRDCCGGRSLSLYILDACGPQFPILAVHCGPEWLAMMAAALLQEMGQ